MKKPTIVVTAAAGKTGSATAKQLLAQGYPVRVLVRRADARSEQLRRAGAQIVVGSLEDLADLRACVRGAQRAYFCPPLEPGTLRRATLFATAAEEAKLEVVVVLSQWLADPSHPSLHAREKWLSERTLERISGAGVVRVSPGWFADNYMAALEAVAQLGLLAMPLGEGLNAPPSNDDIARVVVGALTSPELHIGKAYRPTGPRLLSPEEIASIFGTVLGRTVKYQDAPIGLFMKVARSLGLSSFVVAQLYWFLEEYRRNAFGVGAPTDAVLEVGGAPPEDFELIVRRYVAQSPVAKRSLGAKCRAILHLIQALLTPGRALESLEAELAIPRLSRPNFAQDSVAWRESHLRAPEAGRDRAAVVRSAQ